LAEVTEIAQRVHREIQDSIVADVDAGLGPAPWS
jgi:hypothetical protein